MAGSLRTVRSREKIQIHDRRKDHSKKNDGGPVIDLLLSGYDDVHKEKPDVEHQDIDNEYRTAAHSWLLVINEDVST
jgi:hypothetical protein